MGEGAGPGLALARKMPEGVVYLQEAQRTANNTQKEKVMRKTFRFSRGWIIGLALVVAGLMGAQGFAQDARTADTSTVSLQAPELVVQYDRVELVALVKNSQGQPVDGMPVEFRVPSDWENTTTLSPQQTLTQHGEAHTTFASGMTGVIPVTARVGTATQTADIAVTGSGSSTARKDSNGMK